MNYIDLCCFLILFFSSLIGYSRGFLQELSLVLIWYISYILTKKYYFVLFNFYNKYCKNFFLLNKNIEIYFIYFFSFLIFYFITYIFTKLTMKIVFFLGLYFLDKILGLIFGFLRGLIIVFFLLSFLNTFFNFSLSSIWKNSFIFVLLKKFFFKK